jgi:hypothetical protein
MLTLASPALAHEVRQVGAVEVVVGWDDEPAIAGFRNAVGVTLSGPGEDAAAFEVVVVFGDGAETPALPLEPAFDDPTHYSAPIIPTRPGTYTFRISGDIDGEPFGEEFTSGQDTFDDVRNPADLEFPVQDPTRGELAESLERLSGRVPADDAEEAAGISGATWLAGAALLVAVVALIASLRRSSSSRA